MNDYTARVRADGMVRGTGTQPYMEYPATQCVCTWSWGLQPATALIDWATVEAQPELLPLAALTIEILHTASGEVRHTFYGICKQVAPTEGSEGCSTVQEFMDSRELLQWDTMYCVFNKRESLLVDDGTGHFFWRRRYWHIYPRDFNSMRKTYTNGAHTAVEIMDLLFGSPTCESPWTRVYHVALQQPVYDFDCLSGKKLGTCLVELSEALGCQFTLMGGRYRLVWCVRGAGLTPVAPANSDQRRTGLTLSGNPSRVRLLGDRNLYQVMNLELEPDWLRGWETFWNLDALADDLFQHEALETDCAGIAAGTRYNAIAWDNDGLTGRYLAQARSRVITVGAYAALRDLRDSRDGQAFRDYRKLSGRSRLQMPAALYIATVLFRAFRPPRNYQLRNAYGQWMDLWSLELVEQALVEVTHDPVTGEMDWELDVISAGNGYAICQGYQVGQDAYKTLRPEHFKLDQWVANQNTWQRAIFHVDDSGEGVKFILFDAPVINSGDLIKASADGGAYPVMNSQAIFKSPRVRASLIFAGEPFSYVAGFGTRDEVVGVGGLSAQYVLEASSLPGHSRGLLEELEFADGSTANRKALGIANSLLNQQFTYDQGGHQVQAIPGTQLSEVIGRVTVRYSESGATEEVDYSGERDRNVSPMPGGGLVMHTPPERDFDRRAQLLHLLPGQRELLEEARQLRLVGASLRQNPKLARTLMEAFAMAFGMDAMPSAAYVDPMQLDPDPDHYQPRVASGTPLFKQSGGHAVAYLPVGGSEGSPPVVATDPVFMGVTVLDGQKVNGPLHVTATGDDGVVYARVKGPVAVNDTVGLPPDDVGVQTYLSGGPRLAVGQALRAVPAGYVQLVPVRTNGAGEGGTGATMQVKTKQLFNKDYILVVKYDEVADKESGAPFYVAKSRVSRMVTSQTVDGLGFNYSYAAYDPLYAGVGDNNRTSVGNGNTEIQVMLPRFKVGEVFTVTKTDHTGVKGPGATELKWVEESTEREWVKPWP